MCKIVTRPTCHAGLAATRFSGIPGSETNLKPGYENRKSSKNSAADGAYSDLIADVLSLERR
jgi:hypothetical protein